MSTTLKLSIAFTVIAAFVATSQVAEAGEKCPGAAVKTVALKKAAKSDIVDTAVNAGLIQDAGHRFEGGWAC